MWIQIYLVFLALLGFLPLTTILNIKWDQERKKATFFCIYNYCSCQLVFEGRIQKWLGLKKYYYYYFHPHLRTCLLILERREGGERERERNIDLWETHWLVAPHMCPDWGLNHWHFDWGPNPQPTHVPWPRIEPMTLHSVGRPSNQLSHIGQGQKIITSHHYIYCLALNLKHGSSELISGIFFPQNVYQNIHMWRICINVINLEKISKK